MNHTVVLPTDSMIFPYPVAKFIFLTDDFSISFVVKGSPSPTKIAQALMEIPQDQVNEIINIVLEQFSEAKIGETEFSEVTSVVTIKRILPSED